MQAPFKGRVEAFLKTLFGRRKRRSAAFEAFRFSFFEDPYSPRDGLDTRALLQLEGREREIAERMLIDALPDAPAIIGLGALRSRRAARRLTTIFELERAQAKAARVAGDANWRCYTLIWTAQALWRIQPQPHLPCEIIGVLRYAEMWTERMDAAAALAEMPSPEVEDALTYALDDCGALVRHHAARALLMIHGIETDAPAMNHMIYRVMAEDDERREGGRRDIIAALVEKPRTAGLPRWARYQHGA